MLSRVQLFAISLTIGKQAPPSIAFSRQEYCSGLPFPSPGDLLDPGIKPWSPALRADALPSEPPGEPWSVGTEAKKVAENTEIGNSLSNTKDLRILNASKFSVP